MQLTTAGIKSKVMGPHRSHQDLRDIEFSDTSSAILDRKGMALTQEAKRAAACSLKLRVGRVHAQGLG